MESVPYPCFSIGRERFLNHFMRKCDFSHNPQIPIAGIVARNHSIENGRQICPMMFSGSAE